MNRERRDEARSPEVGFNHKEDSGFQTSELDTRRRASVARRGRTFLWAGLALVLAPIGPGCVQEPSATSLQGATAFAATTTTATVQRGDIRSGPRNVRLEMVRQEVDSILWSARWVQPQITGGGADPDTYEVEVYTGFVEIMEGDPNRIIDVDGGTRDAEFWTAYACPDTFYVHVRVRGHGSWRQGDVTPWSDVATGSFTQTCPLPDMPPPPEVTVDTVRTDTTDLDLAVLDLACALQPSGYRSANIPAEPTIQAQADLRTMSGTGVEWGSRRTLFLDGEVVSQVDMRHGGWTDSARYVRLGSGFTLPVRGLEPGPGYSVRFEIDAGGQVEEPDEGNNSLTVACPEVS